MTSKMLKQIVYPFTILPSIIIWMILSNNIEFTGGYSLVYIYWALLPKGKINDSGDSDVSGVSGYIKFPVDCGHNYCQVTIWTYKKETRTNPFLAWGYLIVV